MILEATIAEMFAVQEHPPLLPKVSKFADRASDQFQQVLMELAEATIIHDVGAHERAIRKVAAHIGGIMTLAHLLGRRSMLVVADKVKKPTKMAVTSTVRLDAVPAVEFVEAIQDIVTREPRLAQSAEAVSQLYATEHAFAMARSADIKITQRVQAEVSRMIQEGMSVNEATKSIAKIGKRIEGFTDAYASTVFRTNAWTAFTAGEFEQAQDPDVADLVPAFEFSATLDGDTRPNHAAADGLVAATTDPIWNQFAPPLGYSCRCDLIPRDVYWLRSMNLIDANGQVRKRIPSNFSSARPDKGFGMGRGKLQLGA